MASETLGTALAYIGEILPNRMNSTTIISLINNEMRKVWRVMSSTEIGEIYTVAGQENYTLPSNCDFDMIVENGVFVGTSTNGSTDQVFNVYSYLGPDEQETGNIYSEGVGNLLYLYPTPTVTSCPIQIKYQARPSLFASSDTSVQFPLDEDYIDLIKFRVMSRIAKSGNNPDVTLANNYDMDAKEIERSLRMKRALQKVKTPRKRISYKFDFDT